MTTAQQQTPPGQKQPRWEQAHVQPPPLLMNNACPRLTLTADTPWGHEGIPPSSDNSKNKEKEKAVYKLKCKKAPIARQPIHLGDRADCRLSGGLRQLKRDLPQVRGKRVPVPAGWRAAWRRNTDPHCPSPQAKWLHRPHSSPQG